MKLFTALGLSLLLCTGAAAAYAAPAGTAITAERTDTNMTAQLNLTQEWDKIFPQSDKVNHSKITFRNRYGITLAADMYVPKNAQGKLPAIAVCGPFGAVKEQASGFYAQEMAKRGYITVDKGSVTVNGVSLTVCNPTDDTFQVAIIPYTFEHTNFHAFKVGSVVNLEFDIIGKYISRMIQYK